MMLMKVGRKKILPGLPQVPADVDPKVRGFLQGMREAVAVRLGQEGDPLEKAVTRRELVEAGVAGLRQGGGIGGGSSPLQPIEPSLDYTPPPAPKNVEVRGGFDYIYVSWDEPGLGYNYYAEVFRSTTDLLDLKSETGAKKIGSTTTSLFADMHVGNDRSVFYYWVRFVKAIGNRLVEGPFNATAGTPGQITLDPNYIVGVIDGQIRDSHLHNTLRERIQLIDGPDSMAGSVSARIKAARDVLESQVGDLQSELSELNSSHGALSAAYDQFVYTYADHETARAARFSGLESAVAAADDKAVAAQASIDSFEETYATDEAARATRFSGLESAVGDVSGAVAELQEVVGDANSGLVRSVQQVSVAVGEQAGAIEDASQAITAIEGDVATIKLERTIKLDNNGHVVGIGLANGGPGDSSFIIRADKLAAYAPGINGEITELDPDTNYTGATLPDEFIFGYAKVDGVARFTINADTAIPDASISVAKIKDLTADVITGLDATFIQSRIGTAWITSAHIKGSLQSTQHVNGNPANPPLWRLNANGALEFRASDGGMVFDGSTQKVYDTAGNLRVQIGRLS